MVKIDAMIDRSHVVQEVNPVGIANGNVGNPVVILRIDRMYLGRRESVYSRNNRC